MRYRDVHKLIIFVYFLQNPENNSSNNDVATSEAKNKETLEWEEALKHWVNR